MSMIDGQFAPRRVGRMHGELFGVLPPGHPAETEPATEDYCRWYETLVEHVTGLVIFIVGNVHSNYNNYKGAKFDRRTRRRMYRYADTISNTLGGRPDGKTVARAINRLVKHLGLVVYDAQPGPRNGWLMGAKAFLHREDAERLVRDAFWGHYPDPPEKARPDTSAPV